jgi:hypothetical protein
MSIQDAIREAMNPNNPDPDYAKIMVGLAIIEQLALLTEKLDEVRDAIVKGNLE